jgi:hypothetical protein
MNDATWNGIEAIKIEKSIGSTFEKKWNAKNRPPHSDAIS